MPRVEYRRTKLDVGDELGSFGKNSGKCEGGLEQGAGGKTWSVSGYISKVRSKRCWWAEYGM